MAQTFPVQGDKGHVIVYITQCWGHRYKCANALSNTVAAVGMVCSVLGLHVQQYTRLVLMCGLPNCAPQNNPFWLVMPHTSTAGCYNKCAVGCNGGELWRGDRKKEKQKKRGWDQIGRGYFWGVYFQNHTLFSSLSLYNSGILNVSSRFKAFNGKTSPVSMPVVETMPWPRFRLLLRNAYDMLQELRCNK